MSNYLNFCPNCGTKAYPNAKFCAECGTSLIREVTAGEENRIDNINNNEEIKQKHDNFVDEINRISENVPVTDYVPPESIPEERPPVNKIPPVPTVLEAPTQDSYMNTGKNVHLDTDCPNCARPMLTNHKKGLFSSEVHHHCTNCQIEFREQNDFLVLENAPLNTRLSNKLLKKRYSYNEWLNILAGNYAPDEIKELSKLRLELPTEIPCPVCNNNFNQYKSPGLTSFHYLICSGCSTVLNVHPENKFTLANCRDTYSPLWAYEKNKLTLNEMKRILEDTQ